MLLLPLLSGRVCSHCNVACFDIMCLIVDRHKFLSTCYAYSSQEDGSRGDGSRGPTAWHKKLILRPIIGNCKGGELFCGARRFAGRPISSSGTGFEPLYWIIPLRRVHKSLYSISAVIHILPEHITPTAIFRSRLGSLNVSRILCDAKGTLIEANRWGADMRYWLITYKRKFI